MAPDKLRFDGRVAIVTGAGGGLGREYALLLGERGAHVVVNDLGGSSRGEGQSKSAADKVVDEIRAKGGTAVANYNSVEDGAKIVETAIKNFGRIDIVINNAGILRDKSFTNLSVDDWDLVHRVHLRGSFLVTKAAWPYLKERKYGRVIMTSSGAGVFGNFGQANYSSAKLGLLGLSNTLAIEGAKYGIQVNTIIPVAASRLTQDLMPEDMLNTFEPKYVAPVVAWLCHELCPENGGVFEAAGGWVGRFRWQKSAGKAFQPPDDTMTLETVRDSWNIITDMTDAVSPSSIQDETMQIIEALKGVGDSPANKAAKGSSFTYTPDHTILYALGIGANTNSPHEIKYLYEGSQDFGVIPTFGVIPVSYAILDSPELSDKMLDLNIDMTKFVHGEQYIEMFQPLPSACTLTSNVTVVDVLDKGSGAVIILNADSYNEQGEKVFFTQWAVFAIGAGNFGGKRMSDKAVAMQAPPQRKPDAFIEEKTTLNQAALYRLSGDKNPLHIDPSFAAMGGFESPILHGLCTYGFAARHILRQYCGNDVKNFKSMKARFSANVIPGQTVRTEMWREGNRIFYQCIVLETGKTAISGGFADLHTVIPAETNISKTQMEKPAMQFQGQPQLESLKLFEELQKRLKTMPHLAKQIGVIFEWNIAKNGNVVSTWTLDFKNGSGDVYEGTCKNGKASCLITMEDEDIIQVATGQADPQKLFMKGRLKIKGNIMQSQKLSKVFEQYGAQALKEAKEFVGGSPAPTSAPPPSKPSPQAGGLSSVPIPSPPPKTPYRSEAVFYLIKHILDHKQDLAKEIDAIIQFNILKNGEQVLQYILDARSSPVNIYKGQPKQGRMDCIFTLEDDLVERLFRGQLDPEKAFVSGKLRINGNIILSQRLRKLWDLTGVDQRLMQLLPPGLPDMEKADGKAAPLLVLHSDVIFSFFQLRMEEAPEITREVTKKVKVVYVWKILKDGKFASEWTMDLKNGEGELYPGPPRIGKADCVLTLEDMDITKLLLGKLNPQRAFMTGKLKIRGNIMLTQKLNQLWQDILKSGLAPEVPLLRSLLTDDDSVIPDLRSELHFFEIAQRLAVVKDQLSKEIPHIYEINILKDGKKATQWTIDMKTKHGPLYRGPPRDQKAGVVITLEDDVFAEIVLGQITPEKAHSGKKLEAEGDVSILPKLPLLLQTLHSKL